MCRYLFSTGRNLGYYPSGTVKQITLTDSSDKMLEKANEKLRGMSNAEKERHQVMVADAARLPFPDNSYDTIVDTFGLCSFDDPVLVLKELQRVCKPNGKILLLEHGRTKSYTGLSSYLDKHAERHAKNWGELIFGLKCVSYVQKQLTNDVFLDMYHPQAVCGIVILTT